MEFEQRLNVDLTGVDSMWQRHAVPQELNDQAPPSASRTQEELSLYACTVCDKVFMSMSHARLHCLTHTDVRPFRCHKCEYGTNTRGNIIQIWCAIWDVWYCDDSILKLVPHNIIVRDPNI